MYLCAHVDFVFLLLVLWWNVPDIHSQVMTYKINYCQHFSNYSSAHSGVPLSLIYHVRSLDLVLDGVLLFS